MPSRDILDKLFEVEKKAEAIVGSARDEADRRVAGVKEECEAAFRAAYEARAAELQSSHEETVKASDREFKDELGAYSARLDAGKADKRAFTSLCDELLFGKV